ncbi:MAG: hypothetical protein PUB99_03140 [Oscillospiraceae bacterium]|nr:hypothetical protein [Oscillospiraceae bacterium]
METKWSREKAWAWYNARAWIRGCNFMSSDCANRIDRWQSYGFEKQFHDLYRPSLRPYNPNEIRMMQRMCTLANKDFAEKA